MSDTEPTVAEVQQEEARAASMVPVPVTVEGPVRVQMLPAVTGRMYNVTIMEQAEQIVGYNPRRKRLVLRVTSIAPADADKIAIANTKNDAEDGRGFVLPTDAWGGNSSLEITHCEAVWAAVLQSSAATTMQLSILDEEWAN